MQLVPNWSFARLVAFAVVAVFWVYMGAASAVGFREMSSDDVTFGIWYPSDEQPASQRLGPFEVEVARDAPIRDGEHDIVLFSHGYGGLFRNHYWTTHALADAGFVVIAPQHEADYLVGGHKTVQALDHRYLELSKALNAVLESSEFGLHVDRQRVHGLGYSLGGATILLASGAGFDSQRFIRHCRDNLASDPEFCDDPGMVYRLIQSFRYDVQLRTSPDPFRNPALVTGNVILVAPVFQGIDPTPPLSMSRLTVFAVDGDTIAKPQFHARPLYNSIFKVVPSEYRSISGHHYAFISPFPKRVTDRENILVAKDPDGFDRSEFLDSITTQIINLLGPDTRGDRILPIKGVD